MQATPPNYESHLQAVYEALLGSGDIAIDVGAHLGRHTFPMARRVFPRGKILAFEPLPFCREVLRRKAALLDRDLIPILEISPDALGEEDTSTEFVVARDAPGYSGLRERPYDSPTRLQRIPVRVRRLDDLVLGLPSVQFIKIDAEGGEYHILRGAKRCLEKFRPVVGFECGARALAGYGVGPADVAALWSEVGYKLFSITGELLTEDDFRRRVAEESLWDYVAVPAEDGRVLERVRSTLLRSWDMGQAMRGPTSYEEINDARLGLLRPPLHSWPARMLARAVAGVVLYLSRFIVRRQQDINLYLLQALRHLSRKATHLEERIAELEGRLKSEARTRDAA